MERSQKIILTVVFALLLCMIAATVIVALVRDDKKVPFTPPPFEEAAVSGVPTDADGTLSYSSLEIKEGFSVSLCGTPALDDDGTLTVYFTSDEKNTVYVRLLVYTEDGREIGATGLLKPNEYVKTVALENAPAAGAKLVFKILSYEPDTYYSMGSATASVISHAAQNNP